MIRSLLLASIITSLSAYAATPDSTAVYLYSADDGSTGLRLAVVDSALNIVKQPIGDASLVNSDFGAWGSGKKMYSPAVAVAPAGYVLSFAVTPDGKAYGHTTTSDFINWTVQSYDTTAPSIPLQHLTVDGKATTGTVMKLSEKQLSSLRSHNRVRLEREARNAERMRDDEWRFPSRDTLVMTLTPGGESYPISDKFIGIFFEDINYAADGGLYAELLQNRDFEYLPSDRGNDKRWHSTKAWTLSPGVEITTASPIHPNNPHYASLSKATSTLTNEGYDGLQLTGGEEYNASLLIRGARNNTRVEIAINDSTGRKVAKAKATLTPYKDGWMKAKATLKPRQDVTDGSLTFTVSNGTGCDIDMTSLMPANTFKGRQNGLRRDLAQALADLHPRFVRFPGGCVAHGDGIDNIYDWKGSIGDLEARRPLRNLWGYHQSRGMGYYEMFLFCEDIGAKPLPVLAAGVPCQNSSTHSHHSCDLITSNGQQDGIPMDEMEAYIRDILDLIEWANGDTTTTWGARRAAAGHPESFNLDMIGIGNEDLISEVFESRFNMIVDSLRKYHPEIAVVGTAGPFYEGPDYRRGWEIARDKGIEYIDEHYYVSPGWLIHNRDFYDSYQRGGTQVYLGEYASHNPDRASNLEVALTIALYLTDVERNGDVVAMTSYAPLLARKHHTQWRPDLIYFDGSGITLTPDYYVQLMYGTTPGTRYIPYSSSLNVHSEAAAARLGHSVTVDETTGNTIVRLANLTPCPTRVDLPFHGPATATQLAGNPADTDVVPVTAETTLDGSYTLPPYSFSVLTIAPQQ